MPHLIYSIYVNPLTPLTHYTWAPGVVGGLVWLSNNVAITSNTIVIYWGLV